MKIKKGDTVVVITGSYKGHRGKVLKADPVKQRVIVEGVNLKTKHSKPSQENPSGGIEKVEAPVHVSNVAYYDEEAGKASRIRIINKDGERTRQLVASGRELEN